MLLDAICGVSILIILGSAAVHSFKQPVDYSTLIGTQLFYHKVKAMNSSQYESFTVEAGVYNQQLNVPVDNCNLEFHPNGTASTSGSCSGDGFEFSLRPGEGGIGYPW